MRPSRRRPRRTSPRWRPSPSSHGRRGTGPRPGTGRTGTFSGTRSITTLRIAPTTSPSAAHPAATAAVMGAELTMPGLDSYGLSIVADVGRRRTFLKATGASDSWRSPSPRPPRRRRSPRPAPGQAGRFLTAHELDTLRAVTGRLIPGPPDDPDPGAVEAGCAEAIDLLLGASRFDPPLIHAGGPFSDRAGASHDDLADFVALDPLAELGWRIRLEGSRDEGTRVRRPRAGPAGAVPRRPRPSRRPRRHRRRHVRHLPASPSRT